MQRRRDRRGFTIIELVIVIGVIAILAALLVPVVLNQIQRAKVAAEKRSIVELAKAMRRFKNDTGAWPFEQGYWPMTTNVDPDQFTPSDTALFSLPTGTPPSSSVPLTLCGAINVGTACWGGPYLAIMQLGQTGGSSMNPSLVDAWGHPRMFAMIRPFDGGGGGTSSSPNGYVVVWSRGPDGLDNAGCYDAPAGCTRDLDRLAQGLPSQAFDSSGNPTDDIIQVAGTAN